MLTVILTGGASRRMGTDKAMLEHAGKTMLQHLTEKYKALGPVAVSVDKSGRFPCGDAMELVDLFPGSGPLNGLVSAFMQTDAELVFLTATDLPNGSPALAQELQERLGSRDACVIRRKDGKVETLFAVYRRSCLAAAKACLEQGRRAFRSLLEQVDTLYVDEQQLAYPLDRLLMNVNTPEEYKKLKGMTEMKEIFDRRSIRRFEETPVEQEKIERLLRAAMQAPSGKNEQPWEFMVVTDAQMRLDISQMSEYAGMCRYAPVLIVTLARMENLVDSGNWWIQDMAACTQNILLQAVTEGLGACWCGFYPIESRIEKMRTYFDLPEKIIPFSIVALGYSQRENKFLDRYDSTRIHWEGYND